MQIEDLSTFDLRPLTHGRAIPRPAAVTHLSAEPNDAELEGLHAQAARLAAIMGLVAGVAVAAPTARWCIADTSAAEFGQEVATDLVLTQPLVHGAPLAWFAAASRRAGSSASTCRTPSSVLGRRTNMREQVGIGAARTFQRRLGAPPAGDSLRQPIVGGEATRCPREVPPLPVKAREIVRSFGGQLSRKGADALSDYWVFLN